MLSPMQNTETVNNCPICGSDKSSHWLYGSDIIYGVCAGEFEYVNCRSCDLIYLRNRIMESELFQIYPDTYDPYQAPTLPRLDTPESIPEAVYKHFSGQKWIYKREKKRLKTLHKRFPDQLSQKLDSTYQPPNNGATLLDFGCGSDAFLNTAKTRGWETIGVDFNPKVVDSVKKGGHTGFTISSLSELEQISDASLDLIRLNHVIEHLYAPVEAITIFSRKLRKNGILHMATPNAAGISAHRFGRYWRGLECPRHAILYTPSSMKKLLNLAGISQFDIIHEENPKDYIRSLGLKNAKKLQLTPQQIETLFENQELFEKYSYHTKKAAIRHKGDRIHIFAKII